MTPKYSRVISLVMLLLLTVATAGAQPAKTEKVKPLMKDFMGINGHTVQFRPDLYRPTCQLVRDYHGMNWDTGVDSTSRDTTFPFAHNRVNWEDLYGSWQKAGFEIDASLMFGGFKPEQWDNPYEDAYKYGKAFAEFFGPSNKALVTSAEVGNEPAGTYSPEQYLTIFKGMAKGLRDGDPKLKILTATMQAGEPDKYSFSADLFKDYPELYDVLNVHVYSFKQGWPTWERLCPEDPSIEYLKIVRRTIAWRNAHAKDKEIWITEFGYDASTQDPPKEGDFKEWMDVSDEVQAQWIVRSFLVFSELDVDRAYLYFFDDNDEPGLHASSGITRKFEPKFSYWAMKHLYGTLGEYRFSKAIRKAAGVYVYEYVRGDNDKDRIWVIWSPTGSGREEITTIKFPGEVVKAERMPLADGPAEQVDVNNLKVTESPVYVWLTVSETRSSQPAEGETQND